MLPIFTSPNRLAAEPVTFTTSASAPSISAQDRWSELEALAGVAVPASMREFYDEALDWWPNGLSEHRPCQMLDVRRTIGNASPIGCEANVYEQVDIAERWRDVRNATWDCAPEGRWLRHWLPIGDNGHGDMYAVSVETDDRAPVIYVPHGDEEVEYVAESMEDHAQNMRALMAMNIYGELASMPPWRRVQFAAKLQPDTYPSVMEPPSFASEYQRQPITGLLDVQPGWRRVVLTKLLRRVIKF